MRDSDEVKTLRAELVQLKKEYDEAKDRHLREMHDLKDEAHIAVSRTIKERDEARTVVSLLEKYAANQGETPGGRADLALNTIRSWIEIAKAKAKT